MFSLIRAKDLFSWANLEYPIQDGISQITGFNYDDNTPEGCGKSSITNILCWVLYGRIPKDVKIDEVVRQGCSGGWGEVVLTSGQIIRRSRKPNEVKILTSDGVVLVGKDAKETQILIDKLVGLNYESFCQTVYFAQGNPKKFILANETEKVSILSDIQDLSKFDRARKRVTETIKDIEKSIISINTSYLKAECEVQKRASLLENIKSHIDNFEQEKASKLNMLEQKLYGLNETLETCNHTLRDSKGLEHIDVEFDVLNESAQLLRDQINNIKHQISNFKEHQRLEDQRIKRLTSINTSLYEYSEKLKDFENEQICPLCKQVVGKEHIDLVFREKRQIERKLDELIKEQTLLIAEDVYSDEQAVRHLEPRLNEMSDEDKKLKIEIENIKLERKKLESTINKRNEIISKIEELEEILVITSEQHCQGDLLKYTQIKNELTEFLYQQKQLETDLEFLKKNASDLNILRDGFKEIKSYMFQSLLNELSVKSTMLAADLFDVPVSINFYNESEDGNISKILTDVTMGGETRSLGLYSGGQMRRLELSVDLALASIISSRQDKPINFRILDEPFSHLSSTSQEKMINLLKNIKGSTIIIEHNPLTKNIIDNVFDIEYRGGVSVSK